MRGCKGDALRRWMMKDPANIIIKEKLQQEAESSPWVDLLSELPNEREVQNERGSNEREVQK